MAEYVYPTIPDPIRIMMCGNASSAWYEEDETVKSEQVLPAFIECFRKMKEELGARCITTFDDDLFMVGVPRSRPWSFYLVYEVPNIAVVNSMVNLFRMHIQGVRLDKYFSIEALIGREFFPAESTIDT